MGRADELIENGFQSFPSKNTDAFLPMPKIYRKAKLLGP